MEFRNLVTKNQKLSKSILINKLFLQDGELSGLEHRELSEKNKYSFLSNGIVFIIKFPFGDYTADGRATAAVDLNVAETQGGIREVIPSPLF